MEKSVITDMKTTRIKRGNEKRDCTTEARTQPCKLFLALLTKTRNKEHRKIRPLVPYPRKSEKTELLVRAKSL